MIGYLRRQIRVLTVIIGACSVSPALAQFGPPGGGRSGRGGLGGFDSNPSFMLRREDVQSELKLSEEQKKDIQAQQDSMRDNPKMREFFDRLRNSTNDDERRAVGEEMRAFTESEMKRILKPEQVTRLQQLSFQRQGTRSLESDETAKLLNLTEDQRAKVKAAIDDYEKARDALRDLPREERDAKSEELRSARDKSLEAVLNSQQRKIYDDKRGSSFSFDDTNAFGQRRPFGGAPGTPGGTNQPPVPARRVDAGPIGATTIVPGAEVGGSPIVSFGGEVAAGKKLEKMKFNFRFAPWADVLKLFAEAAGLTLDLNDVPTGTFNYFDDREFTPTEALDVINGYLLQKGYVLVRRDEFLVVVNIDTTIPPNLVPTVTLEELPKRGRHELMTVLIPLEGITPAEAADEVKELVGPQGKVVALNRSNRLVVTDIGANLRRIHELLSNLNVEVGEKQFRQFTLKHVDVAEAETIVRDLFGLPRRGVENVSAFTGYDRDRDRGSSSSSSGRSSSSSGSPNRADPNARVQVAVDERTNTLLVTAKSEDMKIIDDTIKTIDVEANGAKARSSKTPYLEVYQLKTADPMEVTKTLNVLFPGSVVNEDGRARRIHIHATTEQHNRIQETIRRLDGEGGGTQVAVVPLGRLDAYTATASIQSLFISEGNAAPVIQPHPLGTGLVIRGTSAQVEQIKMLLAELDPASVGNKSQQGSVRTVPLGGRNPEEFLKALEDVWNKKNRAPIHTVVPSSGGTVRDRRVPSAGEEATERSPKEELQRLLNRRESEDRSRSRTSNVTHENTKEVARPQVQRPDGKSAMNDARRRFDRAATELVAVVTERNDEVTQQEPKDSLEAELDQALNALDQKAAKPRAAGDSSSEIVVTINNGNLVLMSDDEEELDALEETISNLARAIPAKTQWTVFYLQSADALETATVLERLFPTSSVATSVGGGGGLMGELTSGISSMGRGLLDVTGLNSITSGPSTLRIIPDTRTNSLYVSGPSHLVDEVEEMLQLLDASETPEQLRNRTPRYIAVKHADVGDVAEIIRDIYKEELEPDRGGAQANPLAALMAASGGGGGGGGRSGSNRGQSQPVKLTLGVDARASRLVVSCSEPLFRQIETMVEEIDVAAMEAKRTVRVVSVPHSKTTQVKAALGAVLPKVKVSTSRSSSSSSATPQAQPQPQQPSPDELRQMMQRGAPSGGGFGGAPGGFGGFPGGGFGGSRSSSGGRGR